MSCLRIGHISRKSIEKQKADKVPLPDFTEKSQFEKLIEKYKQIEKQSYSQIQLVENRL